LLQHLRESGIRRASAEGVGGTKFEYSARYQPDDEWEPDEFIVGVSAYNHEVEDAGVDYNEVRSALGLESLEED
jgi:hypothetical protein